MPHEAPDYQDLGEYVKIPNGSNLKEPTGLLDLVGETEVLDGFWY